MRREWGVRDRRSGGVYRAYEFLAAQDAVNADSARLELMVRWPGGAWVPLEWFLQDADFPTPPPPAAARSLAVEEWLGVRGRRGVFRAVYGAVRGLIFGEQGLFRRHNG